MQEVYAWLLGIVGACILGALIEIILPEGSIRKFIQSIYALIVLFIIISPLPAMLNKDYNANYTSNESTINQQYITTVYKQKVSALEKSIISGCESSGILRAIISITVDKYDADMKILKINIDLTKVDTSNYNGGNIKQTINTVIKNIVSVESDKIIFKT